MKSRDLIMCYLITCYEHHLLKTEEIVCLFVCLFVACSPAQDRDGLAQEENQLNKLHPGSLKKTAEYVYIQLCICIYMYPCKHMLMR